MAKKRNSDIFDEYSAKRNEQRYSVDDVFTEYNKRRDEERAVDAQRRAAQNIPVYRDNSPQELNLQNQILRTNTQTIPRITQQAANSSVYDLATEKLKQYAKNLNSSTEELQRVVDKPVVKMDDLDLTDEKTVSDYLGNQRDAVQFFMDWRSGKAPRSKENQDRYQNLLDTIEAKVNYRNEANSRYNTGRKIAYTDADGRKVNYGDLLRQRTATNRVTDLTASQDDARAALQELSNGKRDLTDVSPVDREALRNAGWDTSADDVRNFTQAYSSDIHKNAAVFSPVVYNESGEVERVLTPDELKQYADDVLNGAGDKLGLQLTETYSGMYAASLAEENAKRIRRLSERLYNDTDFSSVDFDTADEDEKQRLRDMGADPDEYKAYSDLINDKRVNDYWKKRYSDFSTSNPGAAALATGFNIVTSPEQAFEYVRNLGDNLIGWFKAGTNELSASLLPNTYNDFITNLSDESTGAITEEIRSGIRGNGDNEFLNGLADVAANTYGGVTSGIQSALTVLTCQAIFPPGLAEGASLAIMSGEAANGAYHDVIDQGGTVGQAVTYSAAAALNEYLGEKISLENLLTLKDSVGRKKAKEVLLGLFMQGVTEASEEAVTEGLNEFADRLINIDNSEYSRAVQNYMSEGMSEEEAKKKASTDFLVRVGWSAYGGAVGGLFGGGMAVTSRAIEQAGNERRAGQQFRDPQSLQKLYDLAGEMASDDAVKQQKTKLENTISRYSGQENEPTKRQQRKIDRQAGKLYSRIQENNISAAENAFDNERQKAIGELYAEQIGADTSDASVPGAAQAIQKQLDGEKLNEHEQKVVSTPAAQATIEAYREQEAEIRDRSIEAQDRAAKKIIDTATLTSKQEQKASDITDDDVELEEFDLSDDGKTYISDANGEKTVPADFARVAEITDNGVKVEMKNGETVDLNDVSWGDVNVPAIAASVRQLQKEKAPVSAEFATKLIEAYQSGGELGSDNRIGYNIREAYMKYYTGDTVSDVNLPDAMLSTIREEAERARKNDRNSYRTAAESRRTNVQTRGKGKVVFEDKVSRASLKPIARAGVDIMEKFAEANGVTVHFYKSKKTGKSYSHSKYGSANGFYKNGEIWIDVNAGQHGEGLVMFTASHEMTHLMRDIAPEYFDELADFLVKSYNESGVSVRELVRQKMISHPQLSPDVAFEEVIADMCESFLTDIHLTDKASQLYTENPQAANKLTAILHKLIDRIRELYSRFKPTSEIGQMTKEAVKDIEGAYDRYLAGIKAVRERGTNIEKTADKGGAKLQGRGSTTFNSENINTSTQKNQSRSDADYLSAVNRGDMNTAQRMVDEAAERAFAKSKIRDEDGKLMKVYHGTDADFTVFDRAMGRANMDIQGMFFSPWDIDAGGYGSNVRAFYLNITNPADESTGYKALNSHKGENYAGIKAREDLERMGYDGVNNSDEEYIAFNSEQIKLADPVTYDDNGDVVPLSKRFDSSDPDIRYQDRGAFDVDLFDDADDSVENIFARDYATHSKDIGEVLRNISDIELPSKRVDSIVKRIIRDNLGDIDEETRRTLSVKLQMALESVERADPESVSNDMIAAIREAIDGATVQDERTESNYRDLLSVFKGKSYYLTDEQLADLRENDMTLGDLRKRMFGKINIVSRENAKNAQELSLEGLYDVLEYPDEYLPFNRSEWDEYSYHAPIILMDTLEKLRDSRTVNISEMASAEEMDELAVGLAAKFTGAIVEAKYNSKQNPYVSKLVSDLRQKRTEAVERQKEKNKKKLAELRQKERERAEKREADLKEKFREQRANGRESRKRTELRGKIRKMADDFRRRLTMPKGLRYVPQDLIAQSIDVLNAIDLDTGRSTIISEKISALRSTYDAMQNNAEKYAAYDPIVSEMLNNLYTELKGKAIMDMSLTELKHAYDVLKAMHKVVTDAVKMVDTDFKKTCFQLGKEMIAETRAVPKEQSGLFSGWVQAPLRPDVMFNRLAGFKKNSTWSDMARMLNNGQLHMTRLEMEFSQLFDELISDTKRLKRLSSTQEKDLVDLGLTDDEGNTVKITRGMMLSLYMHLLNEDNIRHVLGGGLTVPGMKDYYKGDVKKAFGNGQRSVRARNVDYQQYVQGLKSMIESEMDDYEMEWINKAQEFFDVASRNALNDTTMKLYGFKRAKVDHYFPIHTDSNYRAASFESIVRDMSLENSGFMKERVKASNPIYLEDIVDVINSQIANVSKYCGMTIPIRNFQKVYGTTTQEFETSVQKELNKKFSGTKKNTSATKYIDNLITDLTSGRQTSDGFIAQALARARGNLASATLTLNPRVAIAQAASYPTAAAVIGYKPLLKALSKGLSSADRAEIAEITPLLWKRSQGYSNIEIGDIKELRKQKHRIQGKVKKALGWIEFFDTATVGRLYYACKYYVNDNFSELKEGTEEWKEKVAEVYNDVIEKTQPNYTVMQRPDILRNPNALVKSLTMFMTQRLQNFNIIYDAVGTFNKYRSDFKSGLNEVTPEDVRNARKNLVHAVTSQLVAAGVIVGMKLLADFTLHSMNGYRDDDDELTAEGISWALLNNFADTIFGSVLFGSDFYSLLRSAVSGERYYGVSLSGVDSITEALENITNLRSGVTVEKANKVAESVCQLLGIPLRNAEKIGKGIYYWFSDNENGFMESGVTRTNKQNLHRIEMRFMSGDTESAQKILDSMIQEKLDKGKTETEARSALRSSFTSAFKPRYIEAVKSNNTDEVKNIRKLLYFTGLYGSLSEQDKALENWLK